MNTWPAFWFETNDAWGLVDSPDAWFRMAEAWLKGAHGLAPDEIFTAKLCPDALGSTLPNFGTRAEHLAGTKTLGQFFDEHAIARTVAQRR